MPQYTVLHVYQGIVLECQNCYRICRYAEAAVRHTCPHCGLPVGNWHDLEQATQHGHTVPPAPDLPT